MSFRKSNLPTLDQGRKLIDKFIAKIKADSKAEERESAALRRSSESA